MFAPASVTSAFLDDVIGMWGGSRPAADTRTHFSFSHPPQQLLSILSPRNLTILSRSGKPYETWAKFENLLSRLLRLRLVPALALEDQCIRILRTEWDPVRIKNPACEARGPGFDSSSDQMSFLSLGIRR